MRVKRLKEYVNIHLAGVITAFDRLQTEVMFLRHDLTDLKHRTEDRTVIDCDCDHECEVDPWTISDAVDEHIELLERRKFREAYDVRKAKVARDRRRLLKRSLAAGVH